MRRESRDILSIGSGVIVHPLSCGEELTGGFTSQLIKKFPKLIDHHKSQISNKSSLDSLGKISVFSVSKKVSVANLYCQVSSGQQRKFEYFAFKSCIESLKRQLPNSTYYFPYKLGCGLQGGNWKEIEKLIHTTLPKSIICILPNICPKNPLKNPSPGNTE